MDIGDATAWIASAGAIGTASFAIVEVFKGSRLGVAGSGHLINALGEPGKKAFAAFYGPDYEHVIRQSYRASTAQLGEQLKDALRIALRDRKVADEVSKYLGQDKLVPTLAEAVTALEANADAAGTALTPEALAKYNARVATYTMAVDARVSAACAAASSFYQVTMKGVASFIAIALSLAAWAVLYGTVSSPEASWMQALMLGVIAVPVAPVAADVTSILQTAGDVLTRRSRTQPPS